MSPSPAADSSATFGSAGSQRPAIPSRQPEQTLRRPLALAVAVGQLCGGGPAGVSMPDDGNACPLAAWGDAWHHVCSNGLLCTVVVDARLDSAPPAVWSSVRMRWHTRHPVMLFGH